MCTAFYDVAFRTARAHSGVVTYFHGGEVTILFNGTTDVALHGAVAVRCAFAVRERGMAVHCGIVSDTMRVGNLGTITRLAFQHISPAYVLCQSIAQVAQAEGVPLLATMAVAQACNGLVFKTIRCPVDATYRGEPVELYGIGRTKESLNLYGKVGEDKKALRLGSYVHFGAPI